MGSSLPAAPALGPQHPPGMLALQARTLPAWQRRGRFRAPRALFLGYWIVKIRQRCCLAALQCCQHRGHLALQFVLGLLKTRVMQIIILPCSQLVKHPRELAFVTGDGAAHLLQGLAWRLCRRSTQKNKSGRCLRTCFAGKHLTFLSR